MNKFRKKNNLLVLHIIILKLLFLIHFDKNSFLFYGLHYEDNCINVEK